MIYNKCDDRNNQSGCYDPTAYNALRKIKKDERRALIQKMNALANQNGWTDDCGRVYIVFTVEEIMYSLGCQNQKANKLMYELEKKCGLIERKRQGLGKPNLIYVKNFIDNSKSHIKKC